MRLFSAWVPPMPNKQCAIIEFGEGDLQVIANRTALSGSVSTV